MRPPNNTPLKIAFECYMKPIKKARGRPQEIKCHYVTNEKDL